MGSQSHDRFEWARCPLRLKSQLVFDRQVADRLEMLYDLVEGCATVATLLDCGLCFELLGVASEDFMKLTVAAVAAVKCNVPP